jgi:hypothetical protein
MKLSLFVLTSFFISSAFAQTTMSGKASQTSWGGHWWTMRGGELALGWDDQQTRKVFTLAQAQKFDRCLIESSTACRTLMKKYILDQGKTLSPMMKFDLWVKKQVDETYPEGSAIGLYSRATNNELKIHYITGPEHRHYEASGYAGKCTGWSLSNIDYREPTRTKVINGISFTPADIKGILAAIYNGAQFFVPSEMVLGNAYRAEGPDNNQDFYNDPAPHELIKALEKYVKKEKRMIVADMDPSEGVWNHPIHAYSVKLESPMGGKVKGTITLSYAKDEVDIDEVFTTNSKRPDLTERTLTFELTIPSNWDNQIGSIKKGQWLGESKNKHPDSLIFGLEKDWRKSIYQYKNTDMKLEVNYQLIKKVNLGSGFIVMVDELLKAYYQEN